MSQIIEYSYEEQYDIARNIVESGDFKEYDVDYVAYHATSDALKILKNEISNNNTNVEIYTVGNNKKFEFDSQGNVIFVGEIILKQPTDHYKNAQNYDDYAIRHNKQTSKESNFVVDIKCGFNGMTIKEAYEEFKYRYSTKIPDDFVYSRVELNWSNVADLTPEMKSIIDTIVDIELEYSDKSTNCFDSSDLKDVIDWAYAQRLDVSNYI